MSHLIPSEKDLRESGEHRIPRHLTRTLPLRTPANPERCDGCGKPLAPGTLAEYRLDGALFCSARCADTHAGIPLDTSHA